MKKLPLRYTFVDLTDLNKGIFKLNNFVSRALKLKIYNHYEKCEPTSLFHLFKNKFPRTKQGLR